MRNAFSRALVNAALADKRILLLTGDHGYTLFDDFRRLCPGQFLNAGVAEQNMVGVATGLAKGGYRPVVYGLSAFVPVRVLEQIKLDVCYEGLPVVFVGDGAGVVYSTLGASHQSTEDIAVLRALPHMAILSPADEHEMGACMKLALEAKGPVYLRIGKADVGAIHARALTLAWGGLCQIRHGEGALGWIATGSMVRTALAASGQWPGSPVWSAPALKPLDTAQVAEICGACRALVVLEEHSVYGGLASAVAEIASAHRPTWICPIGIRDRFSRFCGSYCYLMGEHGLTAEAVVQEVTRFLSRITPAAGSVNPRRKERRRGPRALVPIGRSETWD